MRSQMKLARSAKKAPPAGDMQPARRIAGRRSCRETGTVLVIGAAEKLGALVAHKLLEKGARAGAPAVKVRILVPRGLPPARTGQLSWMGIASRQQSLVHAGAELVYGDLKDRASLEAACRGVDTVITTVAGQFYEEAPVLVEGIDLSGSCALIDAARSVGVKHFIYTSLAASQINSPDPLLRAKAYSEAYLKDCGITYTILKPGVLMDSWIGAIVGAAMRAGQPVVLVGQGRTKLPFVDVRDVAAYAVAAVDHPAARNQEIVIAGPESYSWNDVVDAFTYVLDCNLLVQYVRPGEPVPQHNPLVSQFLTALETGGDQFFSMQPTAEVFGIPPTGLKSFVGRAFAAGVAG